jgi:hypothetical protein
VHLFALAFELIAWAQGINVFTETEKKMRATNTKKNNQRSLSLSIHLSTFISKLAERSFLQRRTNRDWIIGMEIWCWLACFAVLGHWTKEDQES